MSYHVKRRSCCLGPCGLGILPSEQLLCICMNCNKEFVSANPSCEVCLYSQVYKPYADISRRTVPPPRSGDSNHRGGGCRPNNIGGAAGQGMHQPELQVGQTTANRHTANTLYILLSFTYLLRVIPILFIIPLSAALGALITSYSPNITTVFSR